MFCTNCGSAVAGETQFCGSCGRKLDRSQQPARPEVVTATETTHAVPAAPVAPPQQRKPRGKGLLIGLLSGGVALILVVVGGIVFFTYEGYVCADTFAIEARDVSDESFDTISQHIEEDLDSPVGRTCVAKGAATTFFTEACLVSQSSTKSALETWPILRKFEHGEDENKNLSRSAIGVELGCGLDGSQSSSIGATLRHDFATSQLPYIDIFQDLKGTTVLTSVYSSRESLPDISMIEHNTQRTFETSVSTPRGEGNGTVSESGGIVTFESHYCDYSRQARLRKSQHADYYLERYSGGSWRRVQAKVYAQNINTCDGASGVTYSLSLPARVTYALAPGKCTKFRMVSPLVNDTDGSYWFRSVSDAFCVRPKVTDL